MTSVAVPDVALPVAEIVSDEDWPAVTDGGLKAAVNPALRPDTDRLIACACPDVTAVVTEKTTDPPGPSEAEGGFTESEKPLAVTAIVAVAV
jgi:hypothetical protein